MVIAEFDKFFEKLKFLLIFINQKKWLKKLFLFWLPENYWIFPTKKFQVFRVCNSELSVLKKENWPHFWHLYKKKVSFFRLLFAKRPNSEKDFSKKIFRVWQPVYFSKKNKLKKVLMDPVESKWIFKALLFTFIKFMATKSNILTKKTSLQKNSIILKEIFDDEIFLVLFFRQPRKEPKKNSKMDFFFK